MMLRGSIEQRGEHVELRTIVAGADVDSGVPGGTALIELVDAALRNPSDLPQAREKVEKELGAPALVDAAGVIGNFQKMVRIADSTGIPVDARTIDFTADLRQELGLNEFASARLET